MEVVDKQMLWLVGFSLAITKLDNFSTPWNKWFFCRNDRCGLKRHLLRTGFASGWCIFLMKVYDLLSNAFSCHISILRETLHWMDIWAANLTKVGDSRNACMAIRDSIQISQGFSHSEPDYIWNSYYEYYHFFNISLKSAWCSFIGISTFYAHFLFLSFV